MAAQAIAAGVWLDGDDWSWPGVRVAPIELGPPSWIPTVPRRGGQRRTVAAAPPSPGGGWDPADDLLARADGLQAVSAARLAAWSSRAVAPSPRPLTAVPDRSGVLASAPLRFTTPAGAVVAPRPRRRAGGRRVGAQRLAAGVALGAVFYGTFQVAGPPRAPP